MRLTLWGTRGSVAAAGPETVRYGGNTSCVEVRAADGSTLVLDAGTGMRRLGAALRGQARRVDVLLTHLHMDHIQGLGFFAPFFEQDREVHLWGPPSTTQALRERLTRYLSPPLFPVRLRELPCRLVLHDVPLEAFEIGPFHVTAALVCHPGPTVGYRIAADGATLAYLPDHEPALGLGRAGRARLDLRLRPRRRRGRADSRRPVQCGRVRRPRRLGTQRHDATRSRSRPRPASVAW